MRTLLVTVAGVLALLALPSPASASCAAEVDAGASPVVLVAQALEVRGASTLVQVEQVWKGPDLAPEVWLRTGTERPSWPTSLISSESSSVDAELRTGRRYLVGAEPDLSTNLCTVERAVGLDERRPDDVRRPVAAGLTGEAPPLNPWLPTGAGIVVLGVITTVLLRRRQRASTDPA